VFESNYLWEILESNDAGKHRFNYRAWPTTPRYEVSVRDDWKQRGSDVDLCNRILVNWTDGNGNSRSTAVTAASSAWSGSGSRSTRSAPGSRTPTRSPARPVRLGRERTQIGAQILTDKINPPKAGTILVRRPIVDQLTGTP
jgi:hypothetical protein